MCALCRQTPHVYYTLNQPGTWRAILPKCLLSGSSPQLLDATLRTIQVPVNQQSVGVGADLGRDPNCQSYQRGSQRLSQTENPLQAGESDLYVLPHSVPPLGWLGGQKDANLGQLFPQLFAAVGKISKHSTGHFLSQFRLSQQLTAQGDIRYVCRCKLVGDGHPVSSTQQVQLHPVDREQPHLTNAAPAEAFPQPAD